MSDSLERLNTVWTELRMSVQDVVARMSAREWREAIEALGHVAHTAVDLRRRIKQFAAEEALLGEKKEVPDP